MIPHTRQSLGVPDWFICDGCSHSPDNKWLTPACNKHDWDYWRGSQLENADVRRKQADKDLRAAIKHNAKATAEGWIDRTWRPVLGEIYYIAVTKFGKKSWRIRTAYESAVIQTNPVWIADEEGKYDPRGYVEIG